MAAERIKRRRNVEQEEERVREQREENATGQPPSYTASHRDTHEMEASQGYTVSSRLAWARLRSKIKTNTKQTKD